MRVKRRQRTESIRLGSGRSPLRWLLIMLLLVVAGAGLWLVLRSPQRDRMAADMAGRERVQESGEELSVWFASPQEDALISEKRRVPPTVAPIDRAKAALQELIAGPKGQTLRTLPAEVEVRLVFIDEQGTAYVDFTEALSRNHPTGPWSEMLTIRSILQTLAANVPEIKRVQILIEGREADTLAGHVDIRSPFATTWVINQR